MIVSENKFLLLTRLSPLHTNFFGKNFLTMLLYTDFQFKARVAKLRRSA